MRTESGKRDKAASSNSWIIAAIPWVLAAVLGLPIYGCDVLRFITERGVVNEDAAGHINSGIDYIDTDGDVCYDCVNEESADGGGVANLEKFVCAAVFKDYLAAQIEAERWPWEDAPEPEDMLGPQAGQPTPSGDGLADAAPEGDDFSTTNIQEGRVDESDVVKNDGSHLYILRANHLDIVRAVPANEMEIVSTVELPGTSEELYLRDDTVVALESRSTYYDWEPGDVSFGVVGGRHSGQSSVVITILDVTDRSDPAIVATIEAEGLLKTSRMIGSKLHLVLSTEPYVPYLHEDMPPTCSMPIVCADADDLLPDIMATSADGRSVVRNLVEWEDLYHPIDPDGYELTAVVTIDVDAPDEPTQSVGVMANAGVVYASPQALYLTDTESDHSGHYRETTDVYKFDLREGGAALVGAGRIPGRLLNRFSLGEYQGYLRAATTIGHVSRSGGGDATNNIYVLGEEDGELVVVGRFEGIAPAVLHSEVEGAVLVPVDAGAVRNRPHLVEYERRRYRREPGEAGCRKRKALCAGGVNAVATAGLLLDYRISVTDKASEREAHRVNSVGVHAVGKRQDEAAIHTVLPIRGNEATPMKLDLGVIFSSVVKPDARSIGKTAKTRCGPGPRIAGRGSDGLVELGIIALLLNERDCGVIERRVGA